jgi:alpha-D-xyloside xylohydrolase
MINYKANIHLTIAIMTNLSKLIFIFLLSGFIAFSGNVVAQIQQFDLVNAPVDISPAFRDFTNTYYFADSLSGFDPASGSGKINYKRHEYFTRQAFNNMLGVFRPVRPNEFPTTEYEASPALPFSIEFVSAKTIRIKATTGLSKAPKEKSLMLVKW